MVRAAVDQACRDVSRPRQKPSICLDVMFDVFNMKDKWRDENGYVSLCEVLLMLVVEIPRLWTFAQAGESAERQSRAFPDWGLIHGQCF